MICSLSGSPATAWGAKSWGAWGDAVEHLGGSRKLVVVLGQSGCGAVSVAIDAFWTLRNYFSLAIKYRPASTRTGCWW